MAAGQVTLYEDFLRWAFSEGINLDNGNVRLALCGQAYVPDAAVDAVWADASADEISHASYPAGGFTPSTPVVTRSGATSKFSSASISQVFATTDSAAKWGVFYYLGTIGALTNPLVAYIDLDTLLTEVPIVAGATLQLNCPAGGWFSWTKTP